MFNPGPNTYPSWAHYRIRYKNGELLIESLVIMLRNIRVIEYLPTFVCFGLVTGGVSHIINTKICSNVDIRHSNGPLTDLWTGLDHHLKRGSCACATLHTYSTVYQTHHSISVNHISWLLDVPWTSAPYLLSCGWNQFVR